MAEQDKKLTREEQLLAELRRGLSRIRFRKALEAEFRNDVNEGARTSRIILLTFGLIMIGVTPLYDQWLLNIPDDFRKWTLFIQWAIDIPTLILALLCILRDKLHRWAEPALIAATVITSLGMVAQRYFGARYGFDIPHEFPTLVIAAVIVLGRVSVINLAPWALLVMTITSVNEFHSYGSNGETIYRVIALWMMTIILLTGGTIAGLYARSNWLRTQLLAQRSSIDSLTGLFNRGQFDLVFEALIQQACRDKKSLAVMLIDIDHFKAFNDHYGHLAGDECLKKIGKLLSETARRPMDLRGRYGGEEFVAVWYDTTPGNSAILAEELLIGLSSMNIKHAKSPTAQQVTASAGLYHCSPTQTDTLADIIGEADKLLYEAKSQGRNRMVSNLPPSLP